MRVEVGGFRVLGLGIETCEEDEEQHAIMSVLHDPPSDDDSSCSKA